MRREILEDVRSIEPLDDLETEHQRDAIEWIESGAELCRQVKPATPPSISYPILCLRTTITSLLVEHRNAGLWLPTGGHVEPDERPSETARREAKEELGDRTPAFLREADIHHLNGNCWKDTRDTTDISLWYVVVYPRTEELHFDQTEF